MSSWGIARRRVERLLVGGALLMTPAVATAQASAATISVDKPCYVNTRTTQAQMTVSGSGFVPGDQVRLTSSDGTVDGTLIASATGTISTTTGAPYPVFKRPEAKAITLTATDAQTSGITATTQVMTTRLWVTTRPEQAPLTRQITWFFSGFTSGEPIFVHYIHTKQVALARFGRAQGPCGVLKAKARLFPGGHPHFRRYGVQIDDSRRYDKNAVPRLRFTLSTSVIFS